MVHTTASLFALQAAYVLSGSATVLVYEWQNGIVVDSASGRKFVHPIAQVIVVCIAMVGLWAGHRLYLRLRRAAAVASAVAVMNDDDAGDGCYTTVGLDDPSLVEPAAAAGAVTTTTPTTAIGTFRWYHAAAPGILHYVSLLLTVLAIEYTTAAIVQILRGSIVIFAAALTRVLLGRTLAMYEYLGISIVVCGVVLVSIATLERVEQKNGKNPFGSNPLLGDTLIISAQFFLALRGVLEERVMKKHNVHELEMAGWEGVCATIACVLTALLGVVWPATEIDDLVQFAADVGASRAALYSTLLLFAMQPVLQGSGLYIIKACSAVTKTILSQLRIIFVWVPSVLFLGGVVSALQLAGFAVLTFGAFLYTDVGPPLPRWCYPAIDTTSAALLDGDGDDDANERHAASTAGGAHALGPEIEMSVSTIAGGDGEVVPATTRAALDIIPLNFSTTGAGANVNATNGTGNTPTATAVAVVG